MQNKTSINEIGSHLNKKDLILNRRCKKIFRKNVFLVGQFYRTTSSAFEKSQKTDSPLRKGCGMWGIREKSSPSFYYLIFFYHLSSLCK